MILSCDDDNREIKWKIVETQHPKLDGSRGARRDGQTVHLDALAAFETNVVALNGCTGDVDEPDI